MATEAKVPGPWRSPEKSNVPLGQWLMSRVVPIFHCSSIPAFHSATPHARGAEALGMRNVQNKPNFRKARYRLTNVSKRS